MLVVSRKANQSIRFPNLGISVHVFRVAGNKVRIGIDAPPDVKVLRDELSSANDSRAHASLGHKRRNQLNTTQVALALAQKQLDQGLCDDAQTTLTLAIRELEKLNDQFVRSSAIGLEARQARPSEPAQTPRALIVEDNDNERELLAGYLRLSGFQVDTASNGLEAIRYLSDAEELPKAIVLDMKMPKLDGAETVSSIRFRPETRDLKLFAVSGSTPAEMNVSIGPNGVNRWFSKPINPGELVRQLCLDVNERELGYVWPLGVTFIPEDAATTASR